MRVIWGQTQRAGMRTDVGPHPGFTFTWVSLILGALQALASVSLFRRGGFGRYFAIAVAALMGASAPTGPPLEGPRPPV
jgi:hypothetical protein